MQVLGTVPGHPHINAEEATVTLLLYPEPHLWDVCCLFHKALVSSFTVQ